MKLIGITQRVDFITTRNEYRDALDQRWWTFNKALNSTFLPLPNIKKSEAIRFLSSLNLSAVFLSGGNTISKNNPNAKDASKERDDFETIAIDWAILNKIPLLGICRGAQMLNYYFEGKTKRLENHVRQNHEITFVNDWVDFKVREVNSFHNYGIFPDTLGNELTPLAVHKDGSIEAFKHKNRNIFGIVWHPEREEKLNQIDLRIMEELMK